MKGHIQLGGTLLIAVLIIAGSFYARNERGTAGAATTAVLPVSERTYIAMDDTNSNGMSDWRETFATTLQTERAVRPDEIDGNTYEKPSTVTGQMAESLFENIIRIQKDGAAPEELTEQFIATAVTQAHQIQTSPQYSQQDITVVQTNRSSIRQYGNAVAEAILSHTPREIPVQIFMEAVKNNRHEELGKLDALHEVQKSAVDAVRLVPVPDILTNHHLNLINALSRKAFDTHALRHMNTDPMLALVRMGEIEHTFTAEMLANRSIMEVLRANNITYKKNEPGAFFTLFE